MTHEDEPKCMVCGGTGTVSGDSGPPKTRGDYQVFLAAYCPNCDTGRALLNAPAPEDALAAMQARAEKAEKDVSFLREFGHKAVEEREEVRLSMSMRIAALESRLAEVAPVVEAAIWQSHISNLVTATGYKSLHKVDCEPNAAKWMDATTDTELAVTAMLAARSLRGAPVPDVHVAVSPEAVNDVLRGVCGNQDRHSPRRCDRPAGHDGDHDQSNWPTGEMAPRSLRGAGEGGGA